jgi:hypothetical protein
MLQRLKGAEPIMRGRRTLKDSFEEELLRADLLALLLQGVGIGLLPSRNPESPSQWF